ncbi:MAG: sensor domain-containing diguanylate cyclase [Firmicutes bacterium]|nr:sensor domain-containing diguanylate cyclase [Bacillota bacterium]
MSDRDAARARAFVAVASSVQAVAAVEDMKTLLSALVTAVREGMDYETCAFGLIEETDILSFRAAAGRLNIAKDVKLGSAPPGFTCAAAVRHGRSLLVRDSEAEPFETCCSEARSELCSPVAARGRTLGVLVACDSTPNAYTPEDLEVHASIADCAGVIVDGFLTRERLGTYLEIDTTTGLYNRKHLVKRISEEVARSHRSGEPFAVVFFDIEGMQEINAVFGHAMGDAVIESVARAVKEGTRGSDVAARFGGDEFALLLPGVDASRAQIAANRVARLVSGRVLEAGGARMQAPEVQWWVVAYPVDGTTPDELLHEAYPTRRA